MYISIILVAVLAATTNAKFVSLENGEPQIEAELDDLMKELNELKKEIPNEDPEQEEEEVDIITKIANINEKEHAEGVVEVDIMKGPNEDKSNEKRNAVFHRHRLWSTKDIPYVFDNSLPTQSKNAILAAHREISNKSCIKFHQRKSSDKYYLKYFKGKGCWSSVGRYKSYGNKGQLVSIGHRCGYVGVAIHETLHALGFQHEQSRYDRDSFVEIFWENIKPGMEYNFKKLSRQNTDNLGTAYDYDGVMHYGRNAFSINGKATILSISNPRQTLGQRRGLSAVDADQLYKLYDCTNTKKGWSGWSAWTPCSGRCTSERTRFCYSDNQDGDCLGVNRGRKVCTDEECKRDGHWGRWSAWTSCSASRCGSGAHKRTRKCNDPTPQKGGKHCVGLGQESIPCSPGCPDHCTFDTGMCWYTKTGNWKQISGRTPSYGTGPTTDVSGNGKYIYMEATGLSIAAVSVLTSTSFPPSAAICLRFAYHMYGSGMGILKVSVTNAGSTKQLKFINGDQGNNWKYENIDFSSNDGDFQIVFTATRGTSYTSDIALDNIFVEKSTCNKGCVFPFVYNGKKYYNCTNVQHTRLWCALDAVYKSGRWKNC